MRRFASTWLFLIAPAVFGQGIGVGTRIDLTTKLNLNNGTTGQFAQVFVPDYYWPSVDDSFTLVVHLHSASWAAENELYRSQTNAILFNIHLGALSSPYQTYFSTQTNFQKILDSVVSVLRSNNIILQPRIRRIILTSFSAGYAGVREILKTYYGRIDALTLADGLHCNSDSATMRIQMQDFLRYARDAKEKHKVFLLTHSSITTSGYESTTSTANYLLANMGLARQSYNASDEIGTQYSRADAGLFHLRGYLGDTASDHLKHLYAMHMMLGQANALLDSVVTSVDETEGEPEGFFLRQNFPNPFNPSTHISYSVGGSSFVSLKVYDVLGREVATLIGESVPAGNYVREWNASALSSGVYFYRLTTNNKSATRRLQLLK